MSATDVWHVGNSDLDSVENKFIFLLQFYAIQMKFHMTSLRSVQGVSFRWHIAVHSKEQVTSGGLTNKSQISDNKKSAITQLISREQLYLWTNWMISLQQHNHSNDKRSQVLQLIT